MPDLMGIFEMMEEGKNEEALALVLQTMETLDQNAEAYPGWLNALGYIYCNLSDFSRAIDVYDRYIELSRQHSNMEYLHIGFHQKAMALRLGKQYAEALDYIRREKEIITAHFPDDPLKLSVNAYEYGYLSYLTDHPEEAEVHMEQCLEYALKTDDLTAQACAYRGLAEIYRKTGKQNQAEDYFDQAYDLFLKAGSALGAEEISQIRKNLAVSEEC